jgi:hypothetical protein
MATEQQHLSDGIDIEVLSNVLSAFRSLAPDDRETLLKMIATNFKISTRGGNTAPLSQSLPHYSEAEGSGAFSEDRSMSEKEFMMQKQPKTDVERVACLAYYLTHYRSTPHFKTLDISKINTDAAQPKFSNAAKAVDNAARNGYLVPATKGNKQLSAAGEQFVQALPDREAAKSVMSKMRQRRRPKKPGSKKSED